MILNLNVLHINGTVETISMTSKCRKKINAVCDCGYKLRTNDPTVAAVRISGINGYIWTGYATKEHISAVNAAGRNW